MKIVRLFVMAFVTVLVLASGAQAASTTFTGTTSGNYLVPSSGTSFSDDLNGMLLAGNTLSITYSFTGLLGEVQAKAVKSVSNTFDDEGDETLLGRISGKKSDGWSGFKSPVFGTSTLFAISFADFSDAGKGIVIIHNISDVAQYIQSLFTVTVLQAGNLSVAYSIQSVPLPGAALLFGSGLAGLIGFARKKVSRS